MFSNYDLIKKFKKQREKDILIGFPSNFVLDLLEKVQGNIFKKGNSSPEKFLEEKMNEPKFAESAMKIFEDYARDECLKDIMQDELNSLNSRLLKELTSIEPELDHYSLEQILKKVSDETEFIEKFMTRFDEYASNGRVHIFFFQIVNQDYLSNLRKKSVAFLKGNHRDLFGQNILLWGSANPVLVSIEHRSLPKCNELRFKWVESRLWDENVKRLEPYSLPHFERRLERSVNYFIIDLDKGIAQLRIQLIRPNSLKSLKEEYYSYQEEIDKLLDFKYFRRIELESVVKKLLIEKNIEPMSWEMQLPNGGGFTAKGKPALYIGFFKRIPILSKLKFNIINRLDFFGRKLSCECQLENRDWGDMDVKLKLDGEKDILTVLSSSDHLQVEAIIDRVLSISRNRVINKILKKFLSGRAELERIILSFDYHFTRLEETVISAGHLENIEWLQPHRIHEAMGLLCELFPANFRSTGLGKNRILEKF